MRKRRTWHCPRLFSFQCCQKSGLKKDERGSVSRDQIVLMLCASEFIVGKLHNDVKRKKTGEKAKVKLSREQDGGNDG